MRGRAASERAPGAKRGRQPRGASTSPPPPPRSASALPPARSLGPRLPQFITIPELLGTPNAPPRRGGADDATLPLAWVWRSVTAVLPERAAVEVEAVEVIAAAAAEFTALLFAAAKDIARSDARVEFAGARDPASPPAPLDTACVVDALAGLGFTAHARQLSRLEAALLAGRTQALLRQAARQRAAEAAAAQAAHAAAQAASLQATWGAGGPLVAPLVAPPVAPLVEIRRS